MNIFDDHCHLAVSNQSAPDRSPVSNTVNITGRILCGICPAEWESIASAAESWPGTIPAFGIHPWSSADAVGDWPDRLRSLLLAHPRAWLGEIGLDYLKADPASIPAQQGIFVHQLKLARELERPVNIHCLNAHNDVLRMLDQYYLNDTGRRPFIMHSLSCPHQAVEALAERGACFTVGPLFSRRESERHRRRTAMIPPDRLLLESDAFVKPQVDAADDLMHTLKWLAGVREMRVEEMAGVVEENSKRMACYGG